MVMTRETPNHVLERTSVGETIGVGAMVLMPLVTRGVIVRRPWAVNLAERLDADRHAVEFLQRLRRRHGSGPLQLRVAGRSAAVVLDPADLRRVLEESPDPFAIATREKRAALRHFQPNGALISTGPVRAERRSFNEVVLDSEQPVHRMGADMLAVIAEELSVLRRAAVGSGELDWDSFIQSWFRIVRRVVLGDSAREDHEVTDLLLKLRSDANWAFARPRRGKVRTDFLGRLRDYCTRAEPGSLAALVATTPAAPGTVPHEQIPQWLFAFDAAAWATFRALALLATHPEMAALAREEVAGRDLTEPAHLPFLRATVLESLRLWPTTPAILRDTIRRTEWSGGDLPEGTSLLLYAPFFHRDDEHLEAANRFAPELWLEGADRELPLVPFSDGPGICPGRNVVLLVASTVLAHILADTEVSLVEERGLADRDQLPGTLSPFRLRYRLAAISPA
jgi:cytochrome P450